MSVHHDTNASCLDEDDTIENKISIISSTMSILDSWINSGVKHGRVPINILDQWMHDVCFVGYTPPGVPAPITTTKNEKKFKPISPQIPSNNIQLKSISLSTKKLRKLDEDSNTSSPKKSIIMHPTKQEYNITKSPSTIAIKSTEAKVEANKSIDRLKMQSIVHYTPPCLSNYEILSVIGRGGFSKVFAVREKRSGYIRAMKVVSKANLIKEKLVENCSLEKRLLETFKDHPFIVDIHASFQTSQQLFFVQEYLSGGDLFHLVKQSGRLSEEIAVKYLSEIIIALKSIHEADVCFIDLRPENVCLTPDKKHVKLIDFGLARPIARESSNGEGCTRTNSDSSSRNNNEICGNPEYISPEMLQRSGYGKYTDWWSLGCLAYELLTGFPPFHQKHNHTNSSTKRAITTKSLPFEFNSQQLLFHRIRSGLVDYPSYLSSEAIHLIQGLLQQRVRVRLGSHDDALEIMQHGLFKKYNIDWGLLANDSNHNNNNDNNNNNNNNNNIQSNDRSSSTVLEVSNVDVVFTSMNTNLPGYRDNVLNYISAEEEADIFSEFPQSLH